MNKHDYYRQHGNVTPPPRLRPNFQQLDSKSKRAHDAFTKQPPLSSLMDRQPRQLIVE